MTGLDAMIDEAAEESFEQWKARREMLRLSGTSLAGLPSLPDTGRSDGEPGPSSLRERMLSISQLRDLPPPAPLIDGILDLDNVSLLYGRRGSYKSFLALDWALCVATGTPWAGRDVEQGPAVFIAGEGVAGMYPRVAAWVQRNEGTRPGDDDFLLLPETVNLLSPGSVGLLVDTLATIKPRVVVWDTLARCMVGGDENSARDSGIALDQLDHVRLATGATQLVVHHAGKDAKAGARGSSAIEAAADSVYELVAGDGIGVLNCTKQKNRAESSPIHLKAVNVGTSLVLDTYFGGMPGTGELTAKERDALAVLAEIDADVGVSMSDWKTAAAERDISPATVMRARKKALETGDLVSDTSAGARSPRYRLAVV